jgi:hypothetical protein
MTTEIEILTKPTAKFDNYNEDWIEVKTVKQLNYFYELYPYNERLKSIFGAEIDFGNNVSLRRRIETDLSTNKTKDLFVLKSSVNGSNRIEKNINATDLSEEGLLYLESLNFASKWKRTRVVKENDKYPYIEFYFNENTGYGTTVELEYVGKEETDDVLTYLRCTASKLNLVEITKEQLDRMYTFYCANWSFYFNNNLEFSKAEWQELGINV